MSRTLPGAMPDWARPIRLPRPIDITHTDPPFAIAGETSTWRVPFRLSKDVPTGVPLKVQLWGGRNNKGNFPDAQVTDPRGNGYVIAELEDGTRIALQPDKASGAYTLSLPHGAALTKGQELVIVLGDTSHGWRAFIDDLSHALVIFEPVVEQFDRSTFLGSRL